MDPAEKILTPHQLWKRLQAGNPLTIGDYSLVCDGGDFAIYYTINGVVHKYVEPSIQDAMVAMLTMAGTIETKG